MRIVIAGAGDVGFHIAKLLAFEEQDIVVIDSDKSVLDYASTHLDIFPVHGDATSTEVLKEAKVKDADLVIAATSSEFANILTATFSKNMGAARTIARVNKPEYLSADCPIDFQSLGIDSLISPKELASREIVRLLKEASVTDIFEFEEGKLSLIGITLNEHCVIIGKTLEETAYLNPDLTFRPIAVHRVSRTFIPRRDTRFELGDRVYFITLPAGIDNIMNIAQKEKLSIKNVMIMGGGSIGLLTARKLEKEYNVILLEENRAKAGVLADQLKKTLVVHGDGSDVELLEEEGLERMDAFLALTGNSETNIIASLVAKNHKVKRAIALIENLELIPIAQRIGIDTMINRKLLAANGIFRYIRKGRVMDVASMHGVEAEAIEYEVNPGSKATKDVLCKIGLPKEAVIGGLIRNGKAIIPHGKLRLEAGDKVVVFTLHDSIGRIEKIFN